MKLSKYEPSLTLSELLTREEGAYYDRKSAKIPISKLAEAIIGFADADGGMIAIGIENRKLQGICSQGNTKVNDFIQCGFEKCFPSVNYEYEKIAIVKENKKEDELLLLHIKPSIDKVHKSEANEVFLRVGDETKKLSYDQRIDIEYDKGSRLYEEQIADGCTMDDLDIEVVQKYKEKLQFKGDHKELLLARGFLKRDKNMLNVTIAGALLFAKYPTQFVPSAKLRFYRYDGIKAKVGTDINISKQKEFEAPLSILIEQAKHFIDSQLREFMTLDMETGKFTSIPEYPPFAWQEGIINAITHRAYNIHGDDIKVFMFDDRLEIHSPGKLPNIVSVDNIRYTRYSRNPKIARGLSDLEWVRELNEGVKRIYIDMEKFFLDPPVYEEKHNTVILTLKNNYIMRKTRKEERISAIFDRNWKTLSNSEKKALELVYEKGHVRTRDLALALNRGQGFALDVLKSLKDKELLRLVASSNFDPNQYYELNTEE